MPAAPHSIPTMLVSILLVWITVLPCRAGDSGEKSVTSLIVSDAGIALDDAVSFWSAPLRFGGGDWLLAGGATGVLVGTMAIDEELRRRIAGPPGTDSPGLWQIPTAFGEAKYAGMLGAGMYATGLATEDDGLRITGRLVLESMALSGSLALTVRYLAGRKRPLDGDGAWDFRGFHWRNARESFPSGHTVVAFAVSTVLAERIDHPLARYGLYGLASLTALARVRDDQHWTSDVMAGALFGVLAGLHVTDRERSREQGGSKGETRLRVMPTGTGICLLYSF